MKCCVCGITDKERDKLPPMPTGINHPVYCKTTSFYESNVKPKKFWCPECHKEKELKELFELMDKRDISRSPK